MLKKLIFMLDIRLFMVYYKGVLKKINAKLKKIKLGSEKDMKYEKVLKQIESGEINSQEAFELLFPEPTIKTAGKRAHFIKMRIHVPEEGKGVNTFLKILFLIPFPMIFARIGLRFASRFVKDDEVDFDEISKMIKYSKNTRINVDSADAQVDIKIM